MAEIVLTNETRQSQVGGVIDAIVREPRLWAPSGSYADLFTWGERAELEIRTGAKRVMAAFDHKQPFGGIVYQQHKQLPGVIELRRIAFAPTMSRLHIASTALRLTEREITHNDFPDAHTIMVDTKVGHTGMIGFLESEGYVLQDVTDLYGLGDELDAVFTKTIAPDPLPLRVS